MTKQSSTWVCLIPGDPIPFRRAVRDDSERVTKVLRFLPDLPLQLNREEVELVRRDIGRTLCFCNPEQEDPPDRFQVDWDRTRATFHELHHHPLPSRPLTPVAVGLRDEQTATVETSQTETAIETELQIELDDDLVEALEKNVEIFGDWVLDPDQIRTKVADGFDLKDLKHIGVRRAADLKIALGIE